LIKDFEELSKLMDKEQRESFDMNEEMIADAVNDR
jgi:hypothetical protein